MAKNRLEKYYDNDRAAKVIYGAVLIFAFIVGQGHNGQNTSFSVAAGTFFAAIAIVLAEVYAEVLGKTIRHKRKLTKQERKEIEQDSLAIISVSIWPTVIFLLSGFGLYNLHSAFNISYVLLLFILFIFSYWASMLSGRSRSTSLLRGVVASLVGLLVVFAKYALGH